MDLTELIFANALSPIDWMPAGNTKVLFISGSKASAAMVVTVEGILTDGVLLFSRYILVMVVTPSGICSLSIVELPPE